VLEKARVPPGIVGVRPPRDHGAGFRALPVTNTDRIRANGSLSA